MRSVFCVILKKEVDLSKGKGKGKVHLITGHGVPEGV